MSESQATVSESELESEDAFEADLDIGSEDISTSDIQYGSEELLDDDDDVSKFEFAEFASTYFKGEDHRHTRRLLQTSLLQLEKESDQKAALGVWVTLLRFMGDLPEAKVSYAAQKSQMQTSVMSAIYSELTGGSDDKDPHVVNPTAGSFVKEKKGFLSKLVSLIPKKKSKDVHKSKNPSKQGAEFSKPLEDLMTTNLQKIHFIAGNAILRPNLRDEVYCQIMKQLTLNPSKTSHARGWILLALCVGCFLPSEQLIKYLKNFILHGPPGYAPYCKERLNRTLTNGQRRQPPSWLELQATKTKKTVELQITFMTGQTETLDADSATTAGELCQTLCEKIGLKDQFGFSIYVAMFDQVRSLGSGDSHVMDAVSQCEQYAKEQGGQERNAPWRLFIRKEIFAPWHDPGEDPVATELIYEQLIRGIKFGEYRCDKDDDLGMVVAQRYFIEHGTERSADEMESVLSTYVPDALWEKGGRRRYWIQLVSTKLQNPCFADENTNTAKIKEDIVNFAKFKWPLLFSRFFEVFKCDGPIIPDADLIIAVNWTGFYVINGIEIVLLELSFPQIRDVSSIETDGADVLTVNSVSGDRYIFSVTEGKEIHNLITAFIDGQKKRSKYAIALKDHNVPGPTFLKFQKGDLIVLAEAAENFHVRSPSGLCAGECDRTQTTGDFPFDYVYVLPTHTKPLPEILKLIDSAYSGSQEDK